MERSSTTAPDIVSEDSFQIGSDVTAGYLAPLDQYLASWPEYKQEWYPQMQTITTFKGHNYGIMNSTDVQTIWYNKDIFKKAGLPTNWQPKSWADILSAAQTIKDKVPGVIPINAYSGIPMNEASTMRTMLMLLYGTNNSLYDYKTNKWVVPSKGIQDSLNFVKQVYNPQDLLGLSNDIALSTTAANTVATQLLPTGKLAIAMDGSWLPSSWGATGSSKWPAWQTTMGVAEMPTQFGEGQKTLTFSGGWSFAISSKSAHKDQAFQFLKILNSKNLLAQYDTAYSQITPRKDVADVPIYQKVPLNTYFTNLLNNTHFRPAFPAYPKISVQITSMMQQVMSGQQSPGQAMKDFTQQVTSIVGASNVEPGK
jgi:multiple sugar transport system substrate-binding protein